MHQPAHTFCASFVFGFGFSILVPHGFLCIIIAMIILGTDEAGYGPNLGPLVISLTVWEADTEYLSPLFETLNHAGIPIGDSKKLYHGGSLTALETGVLVPLRSLKKELLPIATDEEKIDHLIPKFAEILRLHSVRLLDMQHRSLEPEEFNRLLDQFDSKGSLLSNVTLHLIAERLASFTQDNVLVLCDKHGGRNRYLDILTGFFQGDFIQVLQEGRESSVYRVISEGRQWEFRFLAKGETHLPIALASMLSKYQRELAMLRFNAFWQSHVPDLQPTAGYPEDAKRFKQQIAAVQKRLGIADECLWRKR
jgi:ribonuclease HII